MTVTLTDDRTPAAMHTLRSNGIHCTEQNGRVAITVPPASRETEPRTYVLDVDAAKELMNELLYAIAGAQVRLKTRGAGRSAK